MRNPIPHTHVFKQKLSAAFLIVVLALSMGTQAFHLLSHALDSWVRLQDQHAGLVSGELTNHCVVCAQIFHQGHSALPAPAMEVFAPVSTFAMQNFLYIPVHSAGAAQRFTNKGPPASPLFA